MIEVFTFRAIWISVLIACSLTIHRQKYIYFILFLVLWRWSTPTFSSLPRRGKKRFQRCRLPLFLPFQGGEKKDSKDAGSHFFFPSKDDNFFFLLWSCFMKSVKRWINNIEWATLQRYYTQYDNKTNTIWVLFEAFSPTLKFVLGRNSSFFGQNKYFIDLVLS